MSRYKADPEIEVKAAWQGNEYEGMVNINQSASGIEEDILCLIEHDPADPDGEPLTSLEQIEWEIAGYEDMGDIGDDGLEFEQPYDLEVISGVGQAYAKYGDAFLAALELYVPTKLKDWQSAEHMCQDMHGEYDSLKDWAQEVMEEVFQVPGWLQGHIDWEGVGRDLRSSYTTTERDGRIYVFH